MKIERLLYDVNLFDIAIPEASTKTILRFLNMSDGEAVGSLVCSGLVIFSYQISQGGALSQYVGEVNHTMVSNSEASALLQRLGYGFKEAHSKASSTDALHMHHIHIEGGISIDIVCTEVQLI